MVHSSDTGFSHFYEHKTSGFLTQRCKYSDFTCEQYNLVILISLKSVRVYVTAHKSHEVIKMCVVTSIANFNGLRGPKHHWFDTTKEKWTVGSSINANYPEMRKQL